MADNLLYVNARIKALENGLMSQLHVSRLIDAENVKDAFKILQECGFSEGVALDDYRSYENLVALKEKNVVDFFKENMLEKTGIDAVLLKNDYHNAKVLIKAKYLRLDDRSRKAALKEASFRPRFVPQVMKADVLFREMKRENISIAVVVDEYGGTYGIVTLNDLIEQIVGDLNESEDEGNVRKSGNGYLISGLADRESLDELFDLETDSDSATLGGWVMEKLEKIPEPGDTLEEAGILLKVTKANDKRVLEVYAEKLPTPEEDDGEEK